MVSTAMATNKVLFGAFGQGAHIWVREAPNVIVGYDSDDLTRNKITLLGEGRFAVTGIGAVLHTINPRLFEEQLVYIVNHAEDSWVCIDAATLALAEKLAPQTPGVKGWIYMSVDPEPPRRSPAISSR